MKIRQTNGFTTPFYSEKCYCTLFLSASHKIINKDINFIVYNKILFY